MESRLFFRSNVRTTSFESRRDAPWCVKLLGFEARPNICQIRHYPKSFRGDVTEIDLVGKNLRNSALSQALLAQRAQIFIFVIRAPVNPRFRCLPAIHSGSTSRN